jgi:hypothetical protein
MNKDKILTIAIFSFNQHLGVGILKYSHKELRE